jgi:eukaryotic-like serine/threonine-protein kinase
VETPSAIIYQFGPFEVNASSGDLLKAGKRVKLQQQPFRLLVFLLENAGRVVTGEEIQRRIWQGNTFVDFDSSLRVAVRKMREALGDDAENPRYIETIPKRGYRFIVPAVQRSDSVSPITEGNQAPETEERKAGSQRSKKWGFVIVIPLFIAVALGTFRFFFINKKVLTEKDTVVLAEFANSTGDPVFDGTLRQGMAVQLEQSPFLSLISEERTQRTLQLMGQPWDARLTPEIAREVCERTASSAVLDGSIASLGSQYVLGLRARDCRTGEVLAEEQVQAEKKENVLNALDQIASKLRARVGESLTTVKKHDTPLAEATTPSLEALKAYSMGWKVLSSTGSAAAVPFFHHAIEIDPKFAMAYAALGRMYGDIGESILSAENTSRAYQLRGRVSDYEKFFISASYDLQVTGNVEKAEQTCELWVQAYPRAMIPHAFLSGAIYPALGKYETSVAEAQIAVELDPDFSIGYFILSSSDLALERADEARNMLQRAFQRNLHSPELAVQQYVVDFWRDDKAKMEEDVAEAQGESGLEDLISNSDALALAYSGHLAEARRTSVRAADLAQKADHPGMAALYETQAALREGLFGNQIAAKQRAVAALGLSKSRDVEYGAGFALALAGDYSRSQALTNDLANRFPDDTTARFSYVPTLRAVLALKLGEPVRAIELLQTTIPYEFGIAPGILYDSGNFYAVYIRGQSYLAAHQNREAADEFQKILDHRGIVLSDPIGALVHLQMGRAYASAGETAKAKSAYRDFLALWKDADPDIPVLKQANAEYAKLQ